eukprot:1259024-Pyramimonas_sp.AAC.1
MPSPASRLFLFRFWVPSPAPCSPPCAGQVADMLAAIHRQLDQSGSVFVRLSPLLALKMLPVGVFDGTTREGDGGGLLYGHDQGGGLAPGSIASQLLNRMTCKCTFLFLEYKHTRGSKSHKTSRITESRETLIS